MDCPELFARCIENIEDEAPRLIYADWLEEHDQPEVAAFLRANLRTTLRENVVGVTKAVRTWARRFVKSPYDPGYFYRGLPVGWIDDAEGVDPKYVLSLDWREHEIGEYLLTRLPTFTNLICISFNARRYTDEDTWGQLPHTVKSLHAKSMRSPFRLCFEMMKSIERLRELTLESDRLSIDFCEMLLWKVDNYQVLNLISHNQPLPWVRQLRYKYKHVKFNYTLLTSSPQSL